MLKKWGGCSFFSSFGGQRIEKNVIFDSVSTKKQLKNEHSFDFLDRTRCVRHRPGLRLGVLPPDEAPERRHGANARDRRPCPCGRNGLSASAVQGRHGRLRRAGAFFRLSGLRRRRAEPVGSLRFPHGRVLFGTGGFLRHEDRHLCLGADGTCGATVARPRAACGVPQRSRDGAGRRGAGAARYFALVYRPELLRRRLRRAETGHHHHHDADLRHGCLDAGALRPRGRRYLHQGGRCGGRSGR